MFIEYKKVGDLLPIDLLGAMAAAFLWFDCPNAAICMCLLDIAYVIKLVYVLVEHRLCDKK